MSYILLEESTGQVFACRLVNVYGLEYYGAKHWETEREAEGQSAAFLREQGVGDPEWWRVTEVDEAKLKLLNVKLRNDDRLSVYWRGDAGIEVRWSG